MAFEVPPLPYDYDALEPHIDEQTMRVHHDKHHQAYVDNANKALEGTEWAGRPVEQVIANLELLPEDKQTPVRNNAGGHANHSLFWEIMSPDGGGEPSGSLGAAISSTFGGLDGSAGPPRPLERLVGVVHVGLVMLVVVEPHRLLVDVGLERVICVGKRWDFEGHR